MVIGASTELGPGEQFDSEQKARMILSGIKNKFYLVEQSELGPNVGPGSSLDRPALEQAVSNTCVRDG